MLIDVFGAIFTCGPRGTITAKPGLPHKYRAYYMITLDCGVLAKQFLKSQWLTVMQQTHRK